MPEEVTPGPPPEKGPPPPEVLTAIEEVCGYLTEGMSFKDSAQLAGYHRDTVYGWGERYSGISDSIERAKLENKRWHVSNIKKAADKSWQASAWYLERVHHKEFSLKSQFEHSGPDGGPIEHHHTILDEAKKRANKYAPHQPDFNVKPPNFHKVDRSIG
jgi:hypothetical protein